MMQSADTTATQTNEGPSSTIANPAMFFRRWLANPLQMGSVVPSSTALCQRIVRQTRRAPDEAVLELGAGTGVVSRALLNAGVPAERLFVVEIAPAMAAHLRQALPGVRVIEGDARHLPDLIPADWHGRIGTVICGIPLLLLPFPTQAEVVTAIHTVAPGRGFLHFSYCGVSPISTRRHGLTAKREAWTPLNFPPASVWRYTSAR